MKIALFVTAIPFIYGGTELVIEELKEQLEKREHTANVFRLPSSDDYETGIFLDALCAQMLNFDDYDMLISFKWPAYLAVHRQKKLWIFHQFRQVYDLYNKSFGISDNDFGNAIKEMVSQTDCVALPRADKIFAISNTTKRLKEYSGIDAQIMHCPLLNCEKYYKKLLGDYIYYPSRIDRFKRQMLAVEAMRYVQSDVKLVLDGKIGDDFLFDEIQSYMEKYDLSDKITINAVFVSEEDKIERYANCLAGLYLPIDEDSPGFITFEAFYSHKTIITVSDSGGVADFTGDNALIADPSPQAIAEKIDFLYNNKDTAEKMGQRAYNFISQLNVNWDETIKRLLA